MEDMEVQRAMAKKLVEAMESDVAKETLLRVVYGNDLYEAILDDGKVVKPEKKRSTRKPRADKGKSRGTNLPGEPDEG